LLENKQGVSVSKIDRFRIREKKEKQEGGTLK